MLHFSYIELDTPTGPHTIPNSELTLVSKERAATAEAERLRKATFLNDTVLGLLLVNQFDVDRLILLSFVLGSSIPFTTTGSSPTDINSIALSTLVSACPTLELPW
jgi:hypothetical protein